MLTIEPLYDNKWISLKKASYPEKKVPGHIFSHEASCKGQKVAVLPFRYIPAHKGKDAPLLMEALIRMEYTPCWDPEEFCISSITGGVIDDDALKTCLEELEEEAGYHLKESDYSRIEYHGTVFGVKSADTLYHLFSIDLTDVEGGKPTTKDESEQFNYCEWMEYHETIMQADDPMLAVIAFRREWKDCDK